MAAQGLLLPTSMGKLAQAFKHKTPFLFSFAVSWFSKEHCNFQQNKLMTFGPFIQTQHMAFAYRCFYIFVNKKRK